MPPLPIVPHLDTLEAELLARYRFTPHAEARLARFRYIEGWYNPHRRHSALGQRSPIHDARAHETSAPHAHRGLIPKPPIVR